MYNNTYLLQKKSIVTIFLALFFNGCGPELNEIELPPIENYKVGVPLFDGSVAFEDLLSEDDLDMLETDPETNSLYFEILDSIEIASTNDIVQAFGSTSEEDFFSLQFPNPIPGIGVPGVDDLSVAFTVNSSGACSQADYCIKLLNDVEDAVAISYIRFKRGGLQIDYTANLGDILTLTMDNITTENGSSTITATHTADFNGTQPPLTLDLTNVEMDLTQTPILTISLVDENGNDAGTITSVQLTPTNSADRIKMLFQSARDAEIDVPTAQIDTDYLSDIFPEDTDVTFKAPTVKFSFYNPVGAGIDVDLGSNTGTSPPKNGIIAIDGDGNTRPVSFNTDSTSALKGTSCSQVINVLASTDFDNIAQTNVFVCETDELLNMRPTQMVYDGTARYSIAANQEVLFTAASEVKAYFYVKIPLFIGFSSMPYTSGSDLDLEPTSELEEITTAIIHSEITNSIPIGGSLKLTIKESENGATTAEIFLNGNQDGQDLIKAATTNPDGTNAQEVTNYLQTSLTGEEVRAVLNAGYLEMSFDVKADADTLTSVPDPVEITSTQSMYFKMGLYLESTIQLNFD